MLIYEILNVNNGKRYIGQTTYKYHNNRWAQHRSQLRRRVHDNAHLRNAWIKYGESSFQFNILAYANDLDELNKLEESLIIEFDSRNPNKGYNKLSGGKNKYHSEATKTKMRESQKKRIRKKMDAETKEKISNTLKGRPISEERKLAIGRGSKRSWSEATDVRRKIAAKSAIENIHKRIYNE